MPIAVRGIGHWFPSVDGRVLSEIDLTIGDGETISIIGPSGSGKTTLLGIIGLLIRPKTGSVVVDGCSVTRVDSVDATRLRSSALAWSFQASNVFGARSVGDNVLLTARARDVACEDLEGILLSVGLLDRIDSRSRELSGGELQRLSIARAIACRPKYLVADEPTGNLDQSTSLRTTDALFEAVPQGMALIVATHEPAVAELCGRHYSIVDGSLYEVTM